MKVKDKTAREAPKRSLGSDFVVTADDASVEDVRRSDGAGPMVVGIGASAGGLDELEAFLEGLPSASGLAIVIVQHSRGRNNDMLVDILSRSTTLPILQIAEGTIPEANKIYVAPPHAPLTLANGAFHLKPQSADEPSVMQIDYFFSSLAEDQRERSIGVILSGTGTDGTLGLKAIHDKAGATFVQSPGTAKFKGMPASAVASGQVDVVADSRELPVKIVAYCGAALRHVDEPQSLEEAPSPALQDIFSRLRTHTGTDFSAYKPSTVLRRLARRMNLRQIDQLQEYEKFLQNNPQETEALFRDLLIGVTRFFRDPAAWQHLEQQALPELFSRRPEIETFRAWVVGCSTGEEAYTLAITFKEAVNNLRLRPRPRLQIFATDIDHKAIETARAGLYAENIASDMSKARLMRYFQRDSGHYRINPDIREMVVFAPQNVAMHPPFTKVDILSCRNLLIYLSTELQKKLMSLFHYSLLPDGILFLGSAETVGMAGNLFEPVDAPTRIYRTVATPRQPGVIFDFATESRAWWKDEKPQQSSERRISGTDLRPIVDRAIIERVPWNGVLCDALGNIVYISGPVGDFFEPTVGRPSSNVFEMARDGLRLALLDAFKKIKAKGGVVRYSRLRAGVGARSMLVDVKVERLNAPKQLRQSILILLAPSAARVNISKARSEPADKPNVVSSLKADIARLQAELLSTREEMQTSEEELKSSNEELQSTNEELQSTNEELMTSKEELQSLNEELRVVNQELKSKNDELSHFSNDMKNLLNSTHIATLFLDSRLYVRRFTNSITQIVKLIPSDIGRPVTDIACDLDYPGLADDALQVLATLVYKEVQVSTRDGRAFVVRIMPYRTYENVIDGVVITFLSAVSGAANRQAEARAGLDIQVLEIFSNPMWRCTSDGICDFVNSACTNMTGTSQKHSKNWCWLDSVHVNDHRRVTDLWRAAVHRSRQFQTSFRLRGADGTYLWCYCNIVPVEAPRGEKLWCGSCIDVSELMKRATTTGIGYCEQILTLLEDTREPVLCLDPGLHLVGTNRAAGQLLHGDRRDVRGQHVEEIFTHAQGAPLLDTLRSLSEEYSCSSMQFSALDGTRYQVKVLTCGIPVCGVFLLFQQRQDGRSQSSATR